MSEQLALLPGYLTAHLQLALLAILVGPHGFRRRATTLRLGGAGSTNPYSAWPA